MIDEVIEINQMIVYLEEIILVSFFFHNPIIVYDSCLKIKQAVLVQVEIWNWSIKIIEILVYLEEI